VRILGIDPGSHVTGFGVVDFERGRFTIVAAGAIRSGRTLDLSERLCRVADGIRELIVEHAPGEICLERVFQHANVHSALVLAHVRGALMLEVARAGRSVHEYTALQVKQALVGHGHADKDQVRAMVLRLLSAPGLDRANDVSDALAVAICHAHSSATLKRRSGL
jgi:crossover junction endodeoxyribonuclease RuvC